MDNPFLVMLILFIHVVIAVATLHKIAKMTNEETKNGEDLSMLYTLASTPVVNIFFYLVITFDLGKVRY